MGNHRKRGVKLEHHMVQGLRPVLDEIGSWPEVGVCIPGRIRRTGSRKGPFITLQAPTASGLKLAAHGHGSVQEVFIVTGEPETVAARITERFGKDPA